jgi:hypothetical protein
MSDTLCGQEFEVMAKPLRDRISVDLHGNRAALFALARAGGVTPSDWVRATVADALARAVPTIGIDGRAMTAASGEDVGVDGCDGGGDGDGVGDGYVDRDGNCDGKAPSARIRVSLRLANQDAANLAAAAKAAGLPIGVYVAGLAAGIPVLRDGNRAANLEALTASTAMLATLARALRHLSELLRQGSVAAALAYRERLDDVDADIRRHLDLASVVLAELRPSRRTASVADDRR